MVSRPLAAARAINTSMEEWKRRKRNQALRTMDSQVHYLPLTPGFFSILLLLLQGLIIPVQLRILRYAYITRGVGPGWAAPQGMSAWNDFFFYLPITVLPGPPVRSD